MTDIQQIKYNRLFKIIDDALSSMTEHGFGWYAISDSFVLNIDKEEEIIIIYINEFYDCISLPTHTDELDDIIIKMIKIKFELNDEYSVIYNV